MEVPKTEFVLLIPELVPTPEKPVFEEYDPKQGMDSPKNFKIFQRNTVKQVTYNNKLKQTVIYYENSIRQLQEKKTQLVLEK